MPRRKKLSDIQVALQEEQDDINRQLGDNEGDTIHVPDDELREIMEEADAELDEVGFPTCRCGCGLPTRGGSFRPGHDAKLKGQLMRSAYYGDETSKLLLEVYGWYKFYPAFARNEAKRERRSQIPRCKLCGRPLIDEESIERGVGPVCAGLHA